jgi:hypothetical protein
MATLPKSIFTTFNIKLFTYDFSAKSWNDDQSPMHYESGFLRINPGTSMLAFMLSHNVGKDQCLLDKIFNLFQSLKISFPLTGFSEVEEGEVKEKEIHLTSHTIGRMTFGAEPKVTKVKQKHQ